MLVACPLGGRGVCAMPIALIIRPVRTEFRQCGWAIKLRSFSLHGQLHSKFVGAYPGGVIHVFGV